MVAVNERHQAIFPQLLFEQRDCFTCLEHGVQKVAVFPGEVKSASKSKASRLFNAAVLVNESSQASFEDGFQTFDMTHHVIFDQVFQIRVRHGAAQRMRKVGGAIAGRIVAEMVKYMVSHPDAR